MDTSDKIILSSPTIYQFAIEPFIKTHDNES